MPKVTVPTGTYLILLSQIGDYITNCSVGDGNIITLTRAQRHAIDKSLAK